MEQDARSTFLSTALDWMTERPNGQILILIESEKGTESMCTVSSLAWQRGLLELSLYYLMQRVDDLQGSREERLAVAGKFQAAIQQKAAGGGGTKN